MRSLANTHQGASRALSQRAYTAARQGRISVAPRALFGLGAPSKQKLAAKKEELLALVSTLERGVAADEEDKAQVERLARELEKLNPNKKALASPLVNGQWELVYTTSESILGTNKPPFLRPKGPIYQLIDAEQLKAANRETWPFFNQVSAALTPVSASKVDVQFKQFKILGLIPVNAPESAKGSLDVTYLDEELRISRGDKGNLFILTMNDSEKRP